VPGARYESNHESTSAPGGRGIRALSNGNLDRCTLPTRATRVFEERGEDLRRKLGVGEDFDIVRDPGNFGHLFVRIELRIGARDRDIDDAMDMDRRHIQRQAAARGTIRIDEAVDGLQRRVQSAIHGREDFRQGVAVCPSHPQKLHRRPDRADGVAKLVRELADQRWAVGHEGSRLRWER
jgi:hypothetical protein